MKSSIPLLLAYSCLTACHAPQQALGGARLGATAPVTEDAIFDANRTTPLRLLRDLYEQNRFLILAFGSHLNAAQYQVLDSLLQQVGHDPRLKFIVLERSYQDAPMLEEASTTALAVPTLVSRFSSEARAHLSLCVDGEWAYTWARFLPRIRALDAQRPAGHPVLVTAFDGVDLARAASSTNPFALLSVIEGAYRENATSVNFWNGMWHTLGPSDKVIMLYHVTHVVKTVTVLDDGRRVPSDWLGIFLRDHPEAESRIGVVLLDGNFFATDSKLKDSTINSVLKFTQRQAAHSPNRAFGVRLAPFRRADIGAVATDTGMAVYANVPPGNYGSHRSSAQTLPAMLDGVVWLPHVQQWKLQESSDYLPFCARR